MYYLITILSRVFGIVNNGFILHVLIKLFTISFNIIRHTGDLTYIPIAKSSYQSKPRDTQSDDTFSTNRYALIRSTQKVRLDFKVP
jgi:hypothetical protein